MNETNKIPIPVFVALYGILFLVVFNYTLPLMASIYIAWEFGGSHYMTIYTVAFFAVGNALGVPLGRSLAGHVGVVRLLILCLILFAFFSWVCTAVTTLPMFVAIRFIQGLVTGPFYTLVNRLFGVLMPEEKKDAMTSTILTIFITAPVLGASWGGWIAYDYNWRWVFYVDIPIILLFAALLWVYLKNYPLKVPRIPFDGIGYFFYFVGVLSLTFVLITGQEFDWLRSRLLIYLTVIGGVSLLFFSTWSLLHPYPILNLRLFKNLAFSFALLNLAFLFSAYFGMVILLASWLSLYVNYTPTWIGVLLGTMAIAGLFPTFLIMKRFHQTDTRIPLAVALVLLAISCFHTMYFNEDINFGRIAFSRVLAGFGLALFLPPIFRLCFRTFVEEKVQEVMVAFQFVRAISSGIGASLYIILWQRRETFYRDRFGSDLTAFSEQTRAFFSKAELLNLKGLAASEQLNHLLERRAFSFALDDCFFLMGWIMVGLGAVLILTLFHRKESFFPEKWNLKQK